MKKIVFLLIMLLILTGCTKEKEEVEEIKYDIPNEVVETMRINISGNEYIVNLEDNDTAKFLASKLPQEFQMREKNRNEKYVYLSFTLPVDPMKSRNIEKGDVMLYGNNCLVVFYKSFETDYSYTKIGHIDDLPTLGNDDVVMRFYR